MRLADITTLTDRVVDLPVDLWAHAALLGAARQRRGGSQRSDRGQYNTSVDLMGAFGELLLLDQIRPVDTNNSALSYFQTHIYIADGAANEGKPDLAFKDSESGEQIGIDAKTFDCEMNKRYFAINDGKHTALRGHCAHYFCVLARPFGQQAAIAKLVPYDHVDPARETFPQDKWFVGNLLARGSPSRNLFLQTFLGKYFTTPPSIEALRKSPYARKAVLAAADRPDCLQALRDIIPALDATRARARLQEWDQEMESKENEKRAKDRATRAAKKRLVPPG